MRGGRSMFMALGAVSVLIAGPAHSLDAKALLDPPVTPFTQKSVLTVEVRHAPDTTVKFGAVTDVGDELDIGKPAITTRVEEEGAVTTLTCSVEGLKEGRFALQPVSITEGAADAVELPLPGLYIRPLTPQELETVTLFTDNVGVIGEGTTQSDWAMWLAAVAGLLAGIIATALWFLRRKRTLTYEAPRPPWEIAYERLAALQRSGLSQQGKVDAYYVYLSDIVRQYIEARFAIHAPERTTPEFLTEAASSGKLRAEHEALLARFMRHADRVKFARYVPTAEEMENHFAEIRQFIDGTVPKEPEAESKEAAA